MADLQKEGTISFKLLHEHKDWTTNAESYKFGPFGDRKTLDISAFKKADRTLEIRCAFEHFFHTFSGPMPEESPVSIVVTWGKKEIKLYVNGKPCGSSKFGPEVH